MKFITAIYCSEHLKKAAGLFAGLGHLQPLLLATTNANYLLDRFCMERCCSGEYISRIVTSLIFMEILSIIVVRIVLIMAGTGLGTIIGLKVLAIWGDPSANWSDAQQLVTHTRKEEEIRDIISIIIQWIITLGYIQILYAFTTGGRKGHMHWFYSSLLIQHFLNSLIAGSIGFWEVGRALWYLMALTLGPVVVFFYQLYIHSWIRNNGPRYAEYLVVEYQIWLAISISCIATIFWSIGYVIPYISQYQSNNPYKPTELNLTSNPPKTNITDLNVYSVDAGGPGQAKTLTIKSATSDGQAVNVIIHSITVNLSGGNAPIIVRPGKPVEVKNSTTAQDGDVVTAKVEATKNGTEVTLTLTIYKNSEGDKVTEQAEEILASRSVKSGDNVQIQSLHLALDNNPSITVQDGEQASTTAGHSIVKGYAYSPYPGYYYFSGTSAGNNVWNEEWDGGECYYAEYYKKDTGKALLKLCILGNTLGIRYYGTQNANSGNDGTWKTITSEANFSEYLDLLQRTGEFNLGSEGNDADPSDNFKFSMVFGLPNNPTPTWFPLIMQGLSVGAVGSIFPNLIPKTLTCPKTTRSLSVINMFLVTVPHIINVLPTATPPPQERILRTITTIFTHNTSIP